MEGGHLLKLIIERGPREGESLEFQPGTMIKIGRVVRGNTLAIKDAGISSKHLSIQFISGEWILSDLDSSNGTIVNGDLIRADNPAKLGDGDTIKIGELSSIKVSIGVPNHDAGLRRNPSRRTVKKAEQNSVGIVTTTSRRGGKLASMIVDVKEPELGLGFEGQVGVSRKRHRKAVSETVEPQESLATVGTLNKITQTRQPRTRTARSSKNQQRTDSSLLPPHNSTVDITCVLEEVALAQIVEKKTKRGGPRMKRLASLTITSRNETFAGNSSLKDSDTRKEDEEIDGNESKLQEDAVGFEEEEEEEVSAHIVDKKTQRGRGMKKKVEGNEAFTRNSSLKDSHFEEELNKVLSSNNRLEASDLRKEDEIDPLEDYGDGFEGEAGKEEEPDLEKMTLGEWFDYLQVSLTKEINDAAEEMISNMRVKAEMVEELMLQKKNERNASNM